MKRRVFLGLALPEEVRSALVLEQFFLPLPRRVEAEEFHLTLVFLGEVEDGVLEAAHEGFARLAAPAMTLALRGLGLFGGARPEAAWAGVAPSPPLTALQARAGRAAHVAGARLPERRFVPHVTLGRFAPPPPEDALRLERTVAARMGFAAGPWEAREMVLWESFPARKSGRYEELTRYPLGRSATSR